MSNGSSYGAAFAIPIVDHGAPSGLTSKTTCCTPEPVSLALARSVTVARRFAPGSSSAVAGGELSTRRSSTGADSVTFPALSVTTTRRS